MLVGTDRCGISVFWKFVLATALHRTCKTCAVWCNASGATLQFDDPLAGLDAVTKQKVFAEAIGPGSLSADAGRILVTQACMLMYLIDDNG
jgi:hypothetical protein